MDEIVLVIVIVSIIGLVIFLLPERTPKHVKAKEAEKRRQERIKKKRDAK